MSAASSVTPLLYVSVAATAVYAAVLVTYVAVMLGVAYRESRFRRRQSDAEDYDAVLGSRYTIPVSIIAPAFNEEVMVVPAVRSLLDLSYPELEVIVVDDGSTDDTLATLVAAFDMEPRQRFFRELLAAKPVRTVYRSVKEPRLTVVSKDNGGKADALNCGTNFARYRYLCCVDGDTMFAGDALLKAMSLIAKDPARIVGASSLFGISLEPEVIHPSAVRASGSRAQLLADFQHLDLMRSFVAYRAAWSRLDCMLCVSGAFGLWRRDVILEMGGFSSNFTCEDIEMTFRIHERFLRERRPYRILSLPDMVAQTEGPNNVRSLISQRARWQRVTLETIWHYRGMFGRVRYGSVGLVGLPYYVLFECLAPLLQLVSLATLVVAVACRVLGWQAYATFVGIMIFGTAIPTTMAVSLHDLSFRDYSLSELVRMLVLGPLDLLLYRPILIYAGLRGCWEFLRGQKGWNKFARNVRGAATAGAGLLVVSLVAPRANAQAADSVVVARQLAQAGQRTEAADILERRLASNPGDADAHVLHATLLSWRGDLAGARRELTLVLTQQPTNVDALVALAHVEIWGGHVVRAERLADSALASIPDDVDALLVQATTLRQLNRRPEALAVIERAAALAPKRQDVAQLHRLLRQEVRGAEVTATRDEITWADQRDPWRETQLAVRQNTPIGAGIIRVSQATEFGLRDTDIGLEAYPPIGTGYVALGAATATDGRLYPRTAFSTEVFDTFASRVEASLGYRRLDFADAVNVLTGSAGVYEHEYFLGARVNDVTGGATGRSLLLSARRYFSDGVQYAEVHGGFGPIEEGVETPAQLTTVSSPTVGADAMLLVTTRWVITLQADLGHLDTPGSGSVVQRSAGVGLGVRF